MTVIVNSMPGGVVQLFNPDTGKITYKCKKESAYLKLDAFDGIVRFNRKGSKAVVDGTKTSLEDCAVIRAGDKEYDDALKAATESERSFYQEKIGQIQEQLAEL